MDQKMDHGMDQKMDQDQDGDMEPSQEPGDAKALWRQRLRPLRLQQARAFQRAIAALARREVVESLPPGQRLGLYWPLAGEIDLRGLADQSDCGELVVLAAAAGSAAPAGRLALPAVTGPPGQGHLEYRAWQPGEPLEPDHCRIPAPQGPALAPDQLGLLLVPALGFDRQGIRLGSGGGWYDRLRADPAWRAVPALAVLPAACLVERLPRDAWDVPLDGWLDQTGVHWLPDR